jgi:hypothetical protein
LERPDELRRNAPAPDYMLREIGSGRSILVERTQLMREDIQAAKARLIKGGADAIIHGPVTIRPDEIATHLVFIIERKICRSQLSALTGDERILLVRNRLLATMQTFLGASVSFKDIDRRSVDHAFLIASSQLAKLW